MNLRDLGFPSIHEVEMMGLTGEQYRDILNYLGKSYKSYPWWRLLFTRPRMLTGWEVATFIKEMDRKNRRGHANDL